MGKHRKPETFLPEKPILTMSELVGKYTDLMFEIDTSNSFVGSKKATLSDGGGRLLITVLIQSGAE